MKATQRQSHAVPAGTVESLLDRMQAPRPVRRPRRPWPASWLLVSLVSGLGLATLVLWLLLGSYSTARRIAVGREAGTAAAAGESPAGQEENPLVGYFRGDPARRGRARGHYGERPRLLWRYPRRPMCSQSRVGSEEKTWCGTGWTGQPALWQRPDGVREVIFGAFDRKVHFVDLERGRAVRPPYATRDIVKGTVTLDPDGEPLLYFGSRDNRLRILALDGRRPRLLWSLDAHRLPALWNDDWDGNPLVIDDVLYAGGENGWLHAVKLNRDYDGQGRIRVRPELLAAYAGWNRELLTRVGDRNVSIESSPAYYRGRLYFANSAGRVVGLELARALEGRLERCFDFWVGDDVDATVVVDEQGMLYVAAEQERYLPRSESIGQLMKLNPFNRERPLVWSVKIPPGLEDWRGGIWATPALGQDSLYAVTQSGLLLELARADGRILASDRIGAHAWSSPVLAQPWLIVATCRGQIRCYLVDRPGRLELAWQVEIPTRACIESTPLVWNGHIVVGARDGFVYAFGPRYREMAAYP